MTLNRPMLKCRPFSTSFSTRISHQALGPSTSSTRRLFILGLLAAPTLVKAQFRVEVSGVGTTRIPIAIVAFKGEGAINHAFASVVMTDLERSGQFKGEVEIESSMDEVAHVDTGPWRNHGMDALVCGSVTRLPDGRLRLGIRIWDTVGGKELGGQSLTVSGADIRLGCHRIADFVYATLTGVRGIFSTRIAYVTKVSGKYAIQVADADGLGSQVALSSSEPIISPTWSPNGKQIAYVSFESRKPVVYVHDIATGKRRLVANFKGSNSAPAWAPDGRSLAVTLTHEGESQIYILDLFGTSPPKRIMRSESIDTEAKFSADGKTLYFVSDRGGSPQIYKMSIDDGRTL